MCLTEERGLWADENDESETEETHTVPGIPHHLSIESARDDTGRRERCFTRGSREGRCGWGRDGGRRKHGEGSESVAHSGNLLKNGENEELEADDARLDPNRVFATPFILSPPPTSHRESSPLSITITTKPDPGGQNTPA